MKWQNFTFLVTLFNKYCKYREYLRLRVSSLLYIAYCIMHVGQGSKRLMCNLSLTFPKNVYPGKLPSQPNVIKKHTHTARQNDTFGQNCLPISAVFVQKNSSMVPHLHFLLISVVLVQNLGRKTQAWYPILRCRSPFCCFSNHIYFPPIFHLFFAHFLPIFHLFSIHFALVLSCRATSLFKLARIGQCSRRIR